MPHLLRQVARHHRRRVLWLVSPQALLHAEQPAGVAAGCACAAGHLLAEGQQLQGALGEV